MRILRSALLFLCVGVMPCAALEVSMNAANLAHSLDRISHTGRVLYIAAHPDDENTRLLAYLANQRHVGVAYLSLTRGSGGQNLIGSEQGDLLGVIRTQELLAARRIDGARQYFTGARDFGFSKSAAESLAIWGEAATLADVVWVIRTFQPDVIITRFDEQPPNHGHHTASAILAREAFAAAADADRFPEQLGKGVATWQAERLLHNLSTWRPVVIPDDAVVLDVGGYDPRFGLGYGELAARSRTQHKSQGFGRSGERGQLLEHFVLLAGSRPEADLLDGLETTWSRYGDDARPLVASLVGARASLSRDEPEKAVPAMLAARSALRALPDDVRVREARRDIDTLIAAALGLFARALADRPSAAPGSDVSVEVEVIARRPSAARMHSVEFPYGEPEIVDADLAIEIPKKITHSVRLPSDARISAPIWLAREPSIGRYSVAETADAHLPEDSGPLQVALEVEIDEQRIRLEIPVLHAWNDRVHGERERRFLIQPAATVTPLRDAVLSVNGAAARIAMRVRGAQANLEATVDIDAPEGWTVSPASIPVTLAQPGDEVLVEFSVEPSAGAAAAILQPRVVVDGTPWSYREDVIDYDHIPLQQVLRPAQLRAARVDLALGTGLIGYIEGSGDTVAADLEHVGYRVERLDDAILSSGDLERYAVIVVGIRAFNSRPSVLRAHSRLMRYVEQGGRLVVQYHTHSTWDPLPGPIGPYPLELGRGRVTDETAAVNAIDPDHRLLQAPNRLTPADFSGWVQERGLYFGETWDERYTPLLTMADPDEEPLQGSLLVAPHGAGTYIYTGLSFFRQLPAGVPGAYRLLANLLASDGDAD